VPRKEAAVSLPTVVATEQDLSRLPVPARPRLTPADVALPDGFRIEVVLAGRDPTHTAARDR
jgi:hypothetical protein